MIVAIKVRDRDEFGNVRLEIIANEPGSFYLERLTRWLRVGDIEELNTDLDATYAPKPKLYNWKEDESL